MTTAMVVIALVTGTGWVAAAVPDGSSSTAPASATTTPSTTTPSAPAPGLSLGTDDRPEATDGIVTTAPIETTAVATTTGDTSVDTPTGSTPSSPSVIIATPPTVTGPPGTSDIHDPLVAEPGHAVTSAHQPGDQLPDQPADADPVAGASPASAPVSTPPPGPPGPTPAPDEPTTVVTAVIAAAQTMSLRGASTAALVTLPPGRLGTAYTAALPEPDGPGPWTWTVTADHPPAGLDLDPAGTITGTPAESGAYSFTARATDPAGEQVDLRLEVSVATGALSVTVPGVAELGGATPGTSVTAQLGPVTVVDERALSDAQWSVEVSATAFTAGSGRTIPADRLAYSPGPVAARAGLGAFTGSDLVSAATPGLAARWTGGGPASWVTWRPTVTVAVPLDQPAGTYRGVITHSVF
ncbi:hypothetical protein [Nakamurella leprariae]|uniref:Dystroglycan-type cadherin-like domain-containing protein n=1 Tax=Nakamurella leprariae TaxID=2803911 RepID=A0A939C0V6_9ACTN|nr:hypothetical protein [Nakamurella leprariae]MBM9469181.1 hypothetical protein [Nakamurella leprariae]